jgi:hypothetical protein
MQFPICHIFSEGGLVLPSAKLAETHAYRKTFPGASLRPPVNDPLKSNLFDEPPNLLIGRRDFDH